MILYHGNEHHQTKGLVFEIRHGVQLAMFGDDKTSMIRSRQKETEPDKQSDNPSVLFRYPLKRT